MPVGTCLLLMDRLEKQVDGNPSGIWFLPHPEGIVSTCSTSVGYVDPVTWWLALHEVDLPSTLFDGRAAWRFTSLKRLECTAKPGWVARLTCSWTKPRTPIGMLGSSPFKSLGTVTSYGSRLVAAISPDPVSQRRHRSSGRSNGPR